MSEIAAGYRDFSCRMKNFTIHRIENNKPGNTEESLSLYS